MSRERERGIALMLVLWVFMTLGVFALDFSRYIRDDATATINFGDETRSYYAAVAGMNYAIWMAKLNRICVPSPLPPGDDAPDDAPQVMDCLNDDIPDTDENGDGVPDNVIVLRSRYDQDKSWFEGVSVDGALYKVQVSDEDGKVPINRASDELVKALVTYLVRGPDATEGVDRGEERDIDAIVDGIRTWKDPSNAAESGIGNARTEHRLDLRRKSKITFFIFNEELLSVPGVTPDLFYGHDGLPGLGDLVSVFGSESRVEPNLVTAPPAVADALPMVVADPDNAGANLAVIRIRACADIRGVRNQARLESVVYLGDTTGGEHHVALWNDRAPLWSDAPASCRHEGDPPA